MKKKEKITVFDPIGQPSGIFGRMLDPDSAPFAIHDPVYQPRNTAEELGSLKMAPRLDSLDGKIVYLVNTGFAGAREFMEEVEGWFKRHRPDVKTVLYHKKTSMFTNDPELWAEIKKNGDAAVLGVGG
jgi:hypothetical protein